jgi:hypothetical protein
VADLCGGDKPACPTDPAAGTVTGTITAANVKAVEAQGLAAGDFAALVRAIKHEATYVNVHTTEPAGFGSGEIRGQIERNGDDDHRGRGNGKNGGGRDNDDD